jgi:hypothetical protein
VVAAIAVSVTAAPSMAASPRGATVNAVVVKSWGSPACTSNDLIWDDLNAHWSSYGSIPISIDYSDPALCGSANITLAALEASAADVVIISDPAGAQYQISASEIDALRLYAQEGHNVVGSYALFGYGGIDNSPLALLFGINPAAGWTGVAGTTPTYAHVPSSFPLFRHIPNPYVSSGYNQSQLPGDGAWTANELIGGKMVGRTSDQNAAIVVRRSTRYYSIYVASMPEYHPTTFGPLDEQFFYNAIIFPAVG